MSAHLRIRAAMTGSVPVVRSRIRFRCRVATGYLRYFFSQICGKTISKSSSTAYI